MGGLEFEGVRLMRLSEVVQQVGLSRSTIYKRMDEGRFPHPVDLGPNIVRWRSDDVVAWIGSLDRKK
ncbi:MAG: AlpA family phage regulatory protein [Pseudomonadota bacterium]